MPQVSKAPLSAKRILVVDDDSISCKFLRMALEKSGFIVVTASSVSLAQEQLTSLGFEAFDAVVTDYLMPEQSGLDLLLWLREKESCLATIIFTGHEEKQMIADSLRGGAVDFLEKPVDIPTLRQAITKAVALTQQRRQSATMRTAVADLGRTQAWMLQSKTTGLPVRMEICFHPKLEAGGDFFSHFQPAPTLLCCLLTDVSGHDLQAAYLSAYFQGVVRGMLVHSVELPEVFAYFNRLLLDEWSGISPFGAGISVAVCGLLFDFQRQTANVITCGTPTPVYVAPDGRAQILDEFGGYPLGWFPDFSVPARIHATSPGGSFLLWTDGLEDLAEKCGVSPLSAGLDLQRSRSSGQPRLNVAVAADDILFARVGLPSTGSQPSSWDPVVLEKYHGGRAGEIDKLQAYWSRSLKLALPKIEDAQLHDVLLACREAVLNALEHGCQSDPAKQATLQISSQLPGGVVRVWVDDPGPGHDFTIAEREERDDGQLFEKHRGLIFMKHLSSSLVLERRGASVTMEFHPMPPGAALPTSPSPTNTCSP